MKVTGERFVPHKMQKHAEVEHYHRYHAVKSLLNNAVVLDAACGTGYGTSILAECAKTVYGLDLSKEAVLYARQNYTLENVEFLEGSIDKLNFPDKFFDAIVSFETIEHVDENIQNKFLDEIARVIKDDGIMIMSTPNKEIYTDEGYGKLSEWHVHEFYEDEYRSFLSQKFKYVKWFRQFICKTSHIYCEEATDGKLLNFNNSNKGKFFVTIASNKKIDQTLDSVYYYPDEYAALNDCVQLYYKTSTDEFYSEEKSIVEQIEAKPGKIAINLCLENEKVGAIRIDPLMRSCELVLEKIKVRTAEGEEYNINSFETNADEYKGNNFVFWHKDPLFETKFKKELSIETVLLEFEIIETDLYLYPHFRQECERRDQNIVNLQQECEKRDQQLIVIQQECEKREQQISALQRKNLELEETLNSVINSKSWRYTAIFRKK